MGLAFLLGGIALTAAFAPLTISYKNFSQQLLKTPYFSKVSRNTTAAMLK